MRANLNFILLILVISLSPLSASAIAITEIQLATSESPPFQTENDLDQGPVPELVKAAFLQRNIHAKISFLPWARALLLAKTGLYQGIVGAWDNPERRKNFHFSSVLYHTELHLVALKPIRSTDFYNLRDEAQKLGIVRGYSYPAAVTKSQIAVTEVVGDTELFNMLLRGRVDYILMDYGSIDLWLKQLQAQGVATNKVHTAFIESKPVYFLLSKWDPANIQRMAEFEFGLAALTKSGERKRILSRLPTAKP